MKFNILKLTTPLLTAALLYLILGCTNIMELSDATAISHFQILSYYPEKIELGEPSIQNDTINIPFNYGIEEITDQRPLVLKTNIQFKEGIALRNINPDSISFTINKEGKIAPIEFYIESASGKVTRCFIKLQVRPLSEKTEILACYKHALVSAPPGTIISDSTVVITDHQELRFLMPKGGFPVSIRASFLLADTAKVTNITQETIITFNSEDDSFPLTVQSASGRISEWHLSIRRGYEYSPTSGDYIEPYIKEIISLNNDEIDAQVKGDNQISSIHTDHEQGIIFLTVKNTNTAYQPSQLKFPLSITTQFPIHGQRICVGYNPSAPLLFNSYSTTHELYLYHAERLYKRKWKLQLRQWKNDENNIASFIINRYTPAQIILDDAIDINHSSNSIVIALEGDKKYFPLTLHASINLPPSATLADGSSSKQTFTFDELRSSHRIKVMAEDGTPKNYNLSLRYKGELNTEATIESFSLLEYTSTNNRVKLGQNSTIDPLNRVIELEVLDWAFYFPLRIKANINYSYGATITPSINPQEWITFQNINSTYPFTIISEDGINSHQWTIRLKNSEPPKSQEAQLNDLIITQLETGYTLLPANPVKINHSLNEIIITITGKNNSKRFAFMPQLSISPNAKIEGITPGSKLSFASLSEVKQFYILSESETVRQLWRIRVIYTPPLPNGNFDSTSGNVPSEWASANNQFTTGTTIINDSWGKAVKLYTSSALGFKAAGSLFLGKFEFNISQQNTPKKMTYFGIPFTARPIAMTVDMAYQQVHNGQEPDKASIEIELLNWSGTTDIVYHNDDENSDKIKKIATAKLLLDDNGFTWKNYRLQLLYNPQFSSTPVTHISVVFSSSYRGDEFVAGVGSTLKIDNITLEY